MTTKVIDLTPPASRAAPTTPHDLANTTAQNLTANSANHNGR